MKSHLKQFTGALLLRRVERLVKSGFEPAFFFDFDGTLTEIVPHPEDVYLKPVARRVLTELTCKFKVGVISGRRIDDVKRYVKLRGIYYSGNHGVEIEGPGLNFTERESAKSAPYIAGLANQLRRRLAGYGARINSKGYSVSVHYRLVEPSRVKSLLNEVNDILTEPTRQNKIEMFHGKKVVEVKAPVDWDKGKAIDLITRKIGRKCKPVFFGDDTTDEYGFRHVNSSGGVSVYVGKAKRETAARYVIDSPAELIGELAKFLFHCDRRTDKR